MTMTMTMTRLYYIIFQQLSATDQCQGNFPPNAAVGVTGGRKADGDKPLATFRKRAGEHWKKMTFPFAISRLRIQVIAMSKEPYKRTHTLEGTHLDLDRIKYSVGRL